MVFIKMILYGRQLDRLKKQDSRLQGIMHLQYQSDEKRCDRAHLFPTAVAHTYMDIQRTQAQND